MNNYWISWYAHKTPFTLWSPWWITGYTMSDQATICAAVKADSEDGAKQVIINAHDSPVELEWRFVSLKPDAWSPYSDRFPQEHWMRW